MDAELEGDGEMDRMNEGGGSGFSGIGDWKRRSSEA